MSQLHLSSLELAEQRAFVQCSTRESGGVRLPDDRGELRLPRWLRDDLAPRALAAKGNEVLQRCGLPPQPPPPPCRFEAAFEGEIA